MLHHLLTIGFPCFQDHCGVSRSLSSLFSLRYWALPGLIKEYLKNTFIDTYEYRYTILYNIDMMSEATPSGHHGDALRHTTTRKCTPDETNHSKQDSWLGGYSPTHEHTTTCYHKCDFVLNHLSL